MALIWLSWASPTATLADGPVIQAAASRALEVGTTPAAVLEMLAGLKGELTMPVVLFTYSNPLLNVGMEKFCADAALLEPLGGGARSAA